MRRCRGLNAFADIESVPELVDLAIIALSAELTLPMLERCHALGIPAALVYASGYAETNEAEGQARQDELAAFAVRTGMTIAGPNCMGNANFTDGILTTFGQSFQPGEPAGNCALLTQSGNMCSTLFRMARRAGVTFSQIINTGNEASVEFSDYLDFLAGDPATTSAICYIEELRNGPKFLAAAAKFRAAGKLLAVFKVGASEKGAEATRSHTAALAGDTAAYDAAFARAGVARAAEFAGLADLAAYADPAPFIRHFLSEQYVGMIGRYKEAFLKALPHLSRQELTWRLHFVMGALSYTLAGTDALKLFAQVAATDKDNDELLLQRLAPFLVAGLKAPALGDTRKLELVSGE